MKLLTVLFVIPGLVLAETNIDHQPSMPTHVDPRVELMSIIFRLAGNPEYNHRLSKSAYADEVDAHFGAFKDHPAIHKARQLRSEYGVSFDAVMSLAVHLEDTIGLKLKVPFKQAKRLDSRWHSKEVREFLEKTTQFVEQTQFNDFYENHRPLYDLAATRMQNILNKRNYRAWFDEFFGQRPQTEFSVIVSLLNGPNNYGSSVCYPDGRAEISPVLGVTKFDEKGLPVIKDDISSLVVHEFCHSYTNPLVDKYADQLEDAGQRLYAMKANSMKRQAYANWKTLMYESLVRACQVRYARDLDGRLAAEKAALYQHGRGFVWTKELAALLEEYASQRHQYPTMDAFMPKIIAFFDEYAKKYPSQAARTPRIVAIVPANGSTDVDPSCDQIRITFDRSMRDKCWSVVTIDSHFPKISGAISYDKNCKILNIPVSLKPNTFYRFGLNWGRFNSFQSAEGVPLDPVEVTFKTRSQ